jgi:two-component system sensor histidine kinase VanS
VASALALMTVTVSAVIAASVETVHNLLSGLVILAALFALTVWGGWGLAGWALQPLAAAAETVRRLGPQNLGQRIRLDGGADAFKDLADALDDALDRLAAGYESQRRFAANASHELQTPLATSQALIDVGLAAELNPPSRRLLEDLRSLNSRSVATVHALLDLAETADRPLTSDRVELDRLVLEVMHRLAADTEEAGVTIVSDLDPTVVEGDPRMIELLLRNIIENAVRHNLQGGIVDIRLADHDGRAELTVSNSGAGISDQDVLAITEPFFRAGGRIADHAGTTRGRGLGASLVSAVAERHSWPLAIAANDAGGLTVRVSMNRRCVRATISAAEC